MHISQILRPFLSHYAKRSECWLGSVWTASLQNFGGVCHRRMGRSSSQWAVRPADVRGHYFHVLATHVTTCHLIVPRGRTRPALILWTVNNYNSWPSNISHASKRRDGR